MLIVATTCGASFIYIALRRAVLSFIPTRVFLYALFSATKKDVITQFIYLVMKEQNQLCQQQSSCQTKDPTRKSKSQEHLPGLLRPPEKH